jgi:hypothetical protein
MQRDLAKTLSVVAEHMASLGPVGLDFDENVGKAGKGEDCLKTYDNVKGSQETAVFLQVW